MNIRLPENPHIYLIIISFGAIFWSILSTLIVKELIFINIFVVILACVMFTIGYYQLWKIQDLKNEEIRARIDLLDRKNTNLLLQR